MKRFVSSSELFLFLYWLDGCNQQRKPPTLALPFLTTRARSPPRRTPFRPSATPPNRASSLPSSPRRSLNTLPQRTDNSHNHLIPRPKPLPPLHRKRENRFPLLVAIGLEIRVLARHG